jgi:hypothetical protein
MPDRIRWRWLPATRNQSLISIAAGVLLAVSSIWSLVDSSVRLPALEVVVAVAAVVMVVCGIVGLTRHSVDRHVDHL